MLGESLKNVAVLGAAGKMGSGISLLLLQEMARQEAGTKGKVGSSDYSLVLIDANEKALGSLRHYLRAQVRRFAEKNINPLREYYVQNMKIVSNEETIDAFVEGAIDIIRLETEVEQAKGSSLIFEAIPEDPELKTKVFSKINAVGKKNAYYFTNTSSIPIGVISEKSGLKGRLIGYHFYNPPAVQRLLEIIPAEDTDPELVKYAGELAAMLGKVVLLSKDVAGFIGNGHFIRELDYTFRQVAELEKKYPQFETIFMMDRVTQDFLVRPMGVFQLIDYVGIDVCQKVMNIMSRYLDTPFERQLIDHMLQKGVIGGQYPDGSQKEGFFQYEGRKPVKIYSNGNYVELPVDKLGNLPKGHIPWKQLYRDKNKDAILKEYFLNLFNANSLGAKLARNQLLKSREIARYLVQTGVAKSIEDVNTALINGFYHLYGADNPWIPKEMATESTL